MQVIRPTILEARNLAHREEIHEAAACLEQKIHELRSRPESGLQTLISALETELRPLLRKLTEDHLSALKLTSQESAGVVKKAYRQLALKYHPDKNKGGTVELFKCIQGAFESLKDGKPVRKSTKRGSGRKKRYDEGFFRKQTTIQVPQHIRACECTTSSATVQWDPPPGVDVSCYELQWKEARDSAWSVASSSLQSTVCQKHNLDAGNQYHFRVRALHSRTGTWSPFTPTLFVETMESIPGKVVILNEKCVVDPKRKRVTLCWSTLEVAGGTDTLTMILQKRACGSKSWEPRIVLKNVPASSSYCVENLQINQEYEFRIRAKNSVGEGCWSKPLKLLLETEYHKTKRHEDVNKLEHIRKQLKKATTPNCRTKYVRANTTNPDRPKFAYSTWSTTDFIS